MTSDRSSLSPVEGTRQEPRPAGSVPSVPSMPDKTGSVGAWAVLRRPNFGWLLAGTTLTNGAQWIQQVTLSWLVYELTASGTMLGTLNLVRSIATLGLAPIAGVAIDRFSRRALMYGTNSWLFTISLTFGLALLSGHTAIWSLYAFSFLGGVAQAIDLPLRQTVVFVVVPRSLAPSAVALIQTGWAVMRSLGPALGGFLILWFGPAGNFLTQAGAYMLIMFTIMQLHFPATPMPVKPVSAASSLRDGLRYVATERTTRAFLLMGWVLPLFIIPNFSALPPIYAKDIFQGGPETLGALLSAIGVGGIAGGFVAASLGSLERRGLVQLASLLFLSFSLIGFAFSPNLQVAMALFAAAGFFEMIYITSNQTLLQLSIPDAMRGRVTSIVSLNAGLMPVGALAAGIGADLIGPRAVTFWLGAITGLIAIVVFFASPTIREYRLSQALSAR